MAQKKKKSRDLTLLGRSEQSFPSAPGRGILEVFPNPNPERDYWIHFNSSEFTSLCPVTGQPDFATVDLRYVPGKHCVESKSLKFYLASYRSTPSFGEGVTNRILEDLVEVVKPRKLELILKFARRGGLELTVSCSHEASPK